VFSDQLWAFPPPIFDVPGFGVPGGWLQALNSLVNSGDIGQMDQGNQGYILNKDIVHPDKKLPAFFTVYFGSGLIEQGIVLGLKTGSPK
jgi:hypothetical protein